MELSKERRDAELFITNIIKHLNDMQLQRVTDIAIGFNLSKNMDLLANPKAKESSND